MVGLPSAWTDEVVVEGVQGLTGFEHHEVGDIDHVIDAAQADLFKDQAQPIRAGSNPNTADHAGGVAGAEVGILEADADEIGSGGGCGHWAGSSIEGRRSG
jgi:hypothetical protein